MLRIKFLAALLLCACLAAAAAEKSNFTFSETYGAHPVGFAGSLSILTCICVCSCSVCSLTCGTFAT